MELLRTHTLDSCLLLRTKQTGYWLTVRGTALTGTVLLDMEFRDFVCARYNVNPPPTKENTMVSISHFTYIMELSTETEGSSLHVIMRCVMSSSTLHDELSPITVYKENH